MLINYLAEIWGISIVAVSLALLIRPNFLKKLFSETENETTMFFGGIISLVVGVAMVLANNLWVKNWQVIITIIGWIALIKGLIVLFAPQHVKNMAKKIGNASFLPYLLVIMVLIGLAVTYFGFTA